jgi:Domain of unknown function (DUF222)
MTISPPWVLDPVCGAGSFLRPRVFRRRLRRVPWTITASASLSACRSLCAAYLPGLASWGSIEHVFDIDCDVGWDWPPPPVTAPPEEVVDCLVEDQPGAGEPVRWSEYVPDGLLADMLSRPSEVDPEHREFEALERIGAWERVVGWAQAGQIREIASFMSRAEARNAALGASTSQAHESAVAEVGLMLHVSAGTAAARVGDAWSLCHRLPATLAALEQGRITLAKARIMDAETANLSPEHTAAVEGQVLAKAGQQTPGQLRAATRRAVLTADPAAARKRAERARRERGVRIWPEPEGMATLSAYLPAEDAVGVFAVLDEYARHSAVPGDERSVEARRGDALVDLVLNPTGRWSAGTRTVREHTTQQPSGHQTTTRLPERQCPERQCLGTRPRPHPDWARSRSGGLPLHLRAVPARRGRGSPGHHPLHRAARC